jgi:hypothetical protein
MSFPFQVKTIYRTLDLPSVYRAFEDERKAKIDGMIAEVEHEGLRDMLNWLTSKMYKRDK